MSCNNINSPNCNITINCNSNTQNVHKCNKCININDYKKQKNIEIWKRTYQTLSDGKEIACDIKDLFSKHNLLWVDIISQIESTEEQILTADLVCKLDDGVLNLFNTIDALIKIPKIHPCGLGGPIFLSEPSTNECCGILYGETDTDTNLGHSTNMRFQLPVCCCVINAQYEIKTITINNVTEQITDSNDIFISPSDFCATGPLSETITLERMKELYELEKKKLDALSKAILNCKNTFSRAQDKMVFYVDTFHLFDSDCLTHPI